MAVQTVIKKRRDTAANWTSVNPVLAAGEEGYESDTGLSKTGNGSSAWTVLSYDATAHSKQMVKASVAISKGQAVYVNGSDGTNMTVAKASNASEATSSKTFGLMNGNTSSGALNTVVTEGLLGGLDTSSATAGDPVWLGTSGNLIFGLANKPVAPAHLVFIGIVEQAHATTGKIFVKVQNGFELEELHNVSISSAANKQVLQYDSATSLWKNATISAGVTVSDTPPSSPSVGDQWYNSVEGRTYVYYDSFWVDSNPAITGPAGADGADGANGVDGGFNSTQTIGTLSSALTLSSSDAGKLYTNTGAYTVTVQGLSVGQQVDFVQTNAGQITFAAGSGMTLNSRDNKLKTAAQYSPATIKCVATNTYILLGDLAA